MASGQQIYRNNDKPLYRTGNKVLTAICVYNMLLFVGAKVFYVAKNRCVISSFAIYPALEDVLAKRCKGRANANGMLCHRKKNKRILRQRKIAGTKGALI